MGVFPLKMNEESTVVWGIYDCAFPYSEGLHP